MTVHVSGINWLHLYTLQESGGASSIFIYVMVLSSSYSPKANEDAEHLCKCGSDDNVEEFMSRPVITRGLVVQRDPGFHVPVSCLLRYNLFLFICEGKYRATEHVNMTTLREDWCNRRAI